ncbi:MAG: cyclic nucleotide-binding domain-containing protein, partial [Pseudolabrys sp.]
LEGCENKIIETHRVNNSEAGTLRGWLTEALGGRHHADDLARYFKRINVDAGQVIAHQGEPADSMLFIVEGRVGVIVDVGDGRFVRVRSVGRHTTIGEMGLITRQPRSATIEAEGASVLYELSTDAYERIKENNSALSHALHTYVIRVMAERVSFASRVIGALQR